MLSLTDLAPGKLQAKAGLYITIGALILVLAGIIFGTIKYLKSENDKLNRENATVSAENEQHKDVIDKTGKSDVVNDEVLKNREAETQALKDQVREVDLSTQNNINTLREELVRKLDQLRKEGKVNVSQPGKVDPVVITTEDALQASYEQKRAYERATGMVKTYCAVKPEDAMCANLNKGASP